jgi:hypothetical protein
MRALCYAVPGVAKLSVLSSSIQYDKVAVKENTVYRNMGNLWKEVTDSGKVSLLFFPPVCTYIYKFCSTKPYILPTFPCFQLLQYCPNYHHQWITGSYPLLHLSTNQT